MLVLLTLVISIVFVMVSSKAMKKYPVVFYIVGAVITTALIIINSLHIREIPVLLTQWVMPIFTKGIFAAVLWFIVAGIGALPNGSLIIKKLMPVRGELSIISAIITLSHAVTYGITYIRRLGSGNTKSDFIVSFVICLILMLIMIPLTVMSFKMIRKKMNAKKWKNIQKTAYLFYVLIYAHVFVIYLQKRNINTDAVISMITYSTMFFGYVYFRIRKYFIVRKKTENKTVLNISVIIPILFIALCSSVISHNSQPVSQKTGKSDSSIELPQTTTECAAESTESKESTASESIYTTVVSVNKAESSETTTTTVTQTVSETTTQTTEKTEENEKEENMNSDDDQNEETNHESEEEYEDNGQESKEESQPEPQPLYVYQNGSFTASSYGYDGDVTVTITIENDRITEISAYSEESDTWYFDSAFETVKDRILNSQNTSVDAVSGATYSSNAIMSAVQKALDSARN